MFHGLVSFPLFSLEKKSLLVSGRFSGTPHSTLEYQLRDFLYSSILQRMFDKGITCL